METGIYNVTKEPIDGESITQVITKIMANNMEIIERVQILLNFKGNPKFAFHAFSSLILNF